MKLTLGHKMASHQRAATDLLVSPISLILIAAVSLSTLATAICMLNYNGVRIRMTYDVMITTEMSSCKGKFSQVLMKLEAGIAQSV
jgi:hypothetical protein